METEEIPYLCVYYYAKTYHTLLDRELAPIYPETERVWNEDF